MRTRAQTVKVARSPNLDKSVKNRFPHRPAGRNQRSATQHHDYWHCPHACNSAT